MKIGIDASRANKPKKTGVEWYSKYLIENLAKIDTENQYFLYTNDRAEDWMYQLPNNFHVKKLKWPFKYLWTQGRLSLEMILNPPDVLWVPSHVLPLVSPKNSVVTCHDVAFETFSKAYSWKGKLYHRFAMMMAKFKAKKVITVSVFSKKEIHEYFDIPNEKIHVVYNSFNESLYKPQTSKKIKEVLTKHSIKEPYLLYVGRIEPKKNSVNLLKIFKELKEKYNIPHKLVLIGYLHKNYPEYHEALKLLGKYQKDIITPGWIENEELPAFYGGTDCFVFPSLHEGFGIPLLEAFACDAPVVSSDTSSLPEVAKDAALLANPIDIENFASQIYKVLGDENQKQTLIKKGSKRIKDFSWEKAAKETLAIIKKTNTIK